MIKKVGSKYVLFNKTGKKKLGEFRTKKEALRREQEIQFFKSKKKK